MNTAIYFSGPMPAAFAACSDETGTTANRYARHCAGGSTSNPTIISVPGWRNHLLVGTLAERPLRLVRVRANKVTGEEILISNPGRIRDVADGPDGYPYVLFGNPNGMVYRLVPADKQTADR